MKFINKGYHYNVFDLGNARVRKIEKSFLNKITDAYFFEDRKIFNWVSVCYRIFKGKKYINEVYVYIKNNVRLDILGNPVFLKGVNYDQDKVEILGTSLKQAQKEKAQKIIDGYIQNIFESWTQGFSDRVYNFSVNNGVNKNGNVILLDFNEITLSKDEVSKSIKLKRWLRASSYINLNPLYKEYYRLNMETSMTEKNLNLFWKN